MMDEFTTCAMAGCDKPKVKYSPWCEEHTVAEAKVASQSGRESKSWTLELIR
jgi:hypothetical protein